MLEERVEMESKALMEAVTTLTNSNKRWSNIYISSHKFLMAIQGQEEIYFWRHSKRINEIKHQLVLINNPQINLIHHSWNKIATALAGHGIKGNQLSLYHRGVEKPKWLMKLINQAGFNP